MIKGTRYFQTDERRGMFIPEHKLRRRLNRKDKQRKNSYQLMSSQIKQLQRDYASSTGGDSVSREPSSTPNQGSITTLVFQSLVRRMSKWIESISSIYISSETNQKRYRITKCKDVPL